MSDLAVSFTVGAMLGASVGSVTGSTVKHLDRVRKATDATERASAQVAGYRALRSSLGGATASMRAAERRTAELRREIGSTARPSAELRRRFAAARQESQRLAVAVGRQRRALVGQARALKQSAVDVRRLGVEEKRLTATLRSQAAYRDKLAKGVEARAGARSRRESARGDLVEAGALGYAVVRPMQAVVGAAIEFEEKMADVGKVVDFPAPGGLQAMGVDLVALSKRIPVAASGLADIVAEAGQAGIARGELMRFAEDAAKMAVAFDLSGQEAGDAMAGLRTIFQIGQGDVMNLAGAYNHLSNSMAARAPELLDIANRVGGTAKLVGLTGQQLGALGGTLLAMKTPPEVAATSIKSMLLTLGAATGATKDAKQALDDIGLSAAGVEKAMRQDAETAIVGVLEAASKSQNVVGTLERLFGKEHAGEVAKLVEGLDEYAKARRLVSSSAASAASVEREYAVRAATTGNALTLLGNRTQALAINVGSALLPAINAVLAPIGAVVDAAAALAQRFPVVTTAVVGLAVGFVAVKVAAVAYRYAAASVAETSMTVGLALTRMRRRLAETALANWALTGSLRSTPAVGATAAGGIGRVTRSLRILRLALLSTGIGAVVVGLGIAVAWLVSHWEGVKAFFGGVAKGAGDAFGPLATLGDAIGSVIGWIGALFEPVEQSAESLESWASAGEKVGKALKVVGTLIGAVIDPIGTATRLAKEAKAATPKLGDAAKTVAAGAVAATAAVAPAQPAQTLDVVPPPAFAAPIHAPPPAPATTSSVRVNASIVVNPPAGADEQAIAREVRRQIEQVRRRAEVEAGLGESDA